MPKAQWPNSSNCTTTFTSSYGINASFGTSFNSGVELGNGGTLKISADQTNSSSLSLSFNKSVSTVTDDPRLSAQTNGSNYLEAQWDYEVGNFDVAGHLTYSLETYYLFEMDKYSYVNSNRDALILNYSVQFVSKYKTLWWWNDGNPYTSGIRISCFL